MRQRVEGGDAPQVVAGAVVKAAAAEKPRLRYSAGNQLGQVRALRRYLPELSIDKMLRKFNGFPALKS